ncbi:MAG: sigma-70 family RNA polymerase sigma factor [Gemmatimonadota bacterium]|nr:sigma-70 family RNA polymerase sigma factor [Gemmatimonadota bacterium]
MTHPRDGDAKRTSFDAVQFAAGGDYARRVVREHGPLVWAVCKGYARDRDHLDDLYQETWLKVYATAGSFRATGTFRGWLSRLARSVCVSDYRARRAAARSIDRYAGEVGASDVAGPGRPDPLEQTEKQLVQHVIREAIDDLPARERQALTLRLIDERSPAEVARLMRVRPATVRSHIRHALQRLRKRIEDPQDPLHVLLHVRLDG